MTCSLTKELFVLHRHAMDIPEVVISYLGSPSFKITIEFLNGENNFLVKPTTLKYEGCMSTNFRSSIVCPAQIIDSIFVLFIYVSLIVGI